MSLVLHQYSNPVALTSGTVSGLWAELQHYRHFYSCSHHRDSQRLFMSFWPLWRQGGGLRELQHRLRSIILSTCSSWPPPNFCVIYHIDRTVPKSQHFPKSGKVTLMYCKPQKCLHESSFPPFFAESSVSVQAYTDCETSYDKKWE